MLHMARSQTGQLFAQVSCVLWGEKRSILPSRISNLIFSIAVNFRLYGLFFQKLLRKLYLKLVFWYKYALYIFFRKVNESIFSVFQSSKLSGLVFCEPLV